MTDARYIVGIDLGTTNTALASVEISSLGEDRPPEVQVFEVPQVTQPGTLLSRSTLPSFLYLASTGEFSPKALDVPWAADRTFLVGAGARDRGTQVPLRLVNSAKSWLCHSGVDRRSAILPFQAPPEVEKVSPIVATTRYLEHLRDAWDAVHADAALEHQRVLLTVPASFDAVARDLTLDAAKQAGLADVTLLEEPQAAFYAWLARIGESWRRRLKAGDRVLVCDVGGGTTDFSLIEVTDQGGNLALERVAVGDHILLGGDNMDLALAHQLDEKLRQDGKKLDPSQQRALVQCAREAKERLLSDEKLASAPIVILGKGSKLIGGKITTELTRADVERVLLEGFFPLCPADAKPATARRAGFMELGLPFAVDAGITRHLAQFLARHAGAGRFPSHVLFNGGVFNSPLLQARLLETMGSWGERSPVVLEESDHDLAVARGAAYFGASRVGKGIRIRGGTARSYYVGIETAAPSIPGVRPPIRALCIVPFGLEEGSEAAVPSAQLGLVVGEPVEFRFLSSTTRKNDSIGTLLDPWEWPDQLTETAPLETTLPADGAAAGTIVPVRLEVKVTDIGTVEIWSVRTDGPGRWRLEFNVREQPAS